jgi:LytR cell envelope-related transcriptional attenuator
MHRVQEIGAYAGFAAVIGLAVLSALYFSQARDVRRLRDWAGRAPERAAEEEARIASAGAAAQQQRAAAGGGGGPTVAPQPTTLPGTASATPAPGQLPPPRPAPTMASSPTTPILSQPPEPWYKRVVWPEPRYIALIVAGVLVVGGGAAYGIAHLVSNGGGTPSKSAGTTPTSSSTTKPAKVTRKPAAALTPSKITVAVLNGTTITGLASQTADKLQQQGFVRGNTSNALSQGQQAQSVVEYSGNNSRAARLVANKLGIADTEPVDAQTQAKAGDAIVTVIIGADKAPTGTG